MDILALDFGSKKIGRARANSVARIPEPLPIFQNLNNQNLDKLYEEIIVQKPAKVLVGLPRSLAGQETEQSKIIRQFTKQLAAKIQCPVELVDETLSTQSAAKWSVRYPGSDEDSLAACVILERYFEEGCVT